MKVTFVTTASPSAHVDFENGDLSGTESQIYGVAKELNKRGHIVDIIRWSEREYNITNIDGIKIHDIKSLKFPDGFVGGIGTKMFFSARVRDYLHDIQPDVVNIIMKYSSYFTCKNPFPTVHFAFNNPVRATPGTSLYSKMLTGYIEKRIAHNSDILVVRNNSVKSYWEEKVPTTDLMQIPTGIDINRYQNFGDESYILYGGRLSKEKGVRYLVEAYAKLPPSTRSSYPLMIVGEGPEEPQIRSLIKDLGIEDEVQLRSWLPKSEFHDLLARCSVYILPSLHEGMPVALLEAMGSSKPIIASDIPGVNNVVKDGETGYLFSSEDITQLRFKLQELLEKPGKRRSMGATAETVVHDQHSFQKVTDKYLRAYRQAIKSNEK
ncbi:glycosyltransferase family 1 protein [Haloterrigena sp. H1]|uniref:glycosyltransferase family 4 protein n=1 Tax=Haloterrigena sp. H1 TaxID=2552943 RepID=UPI00110E12D7|nr:glycosyltransferase [Haloterrigena sp. H1]TMT87016.1 glycosyltransferase family 1 protein [Haloterrigena sp. H1]